MILNIIRKWFYNRERAIFTYWDGQRVRSIDPAVAYRALNSHTEFDWATTPALVDAPDNKMSMDALGISADAVRDAFDIPAYQDGRYLVEGELFGLLHQFVEWMDALKKNISHSPISPEPTEPESSESESVTNADSPCGSTSTELKQDAVVPL